ncbi:MAG: TMEM175 family protein [Sphingomicrobium sp.]
MNLPPPATFAERQPYIYGLLAAAAGVFCGAAAVAMIVLLMWGGWSPAEEHSIVIIFGSILGGFIAAMIGVIVGLLTGGPVGRFKWSNHHHMLNSVKRIDGRVLMANLLLLFFLSFVPFVIRWIGDAGLTPFRSRPTVWCWSVPASAKFSSNRR